MAPRKRNGGKPPPRKRRNGAKPPHKGNGNHPNLRAWFTTRDGRRRIYAADYGYRGWPIG